MTDSWILLTQHTLALGLPSVLLVFSLWSLLQVGRQFSTKGTKVGWALVLAFTNALATVWFSAVASQALAAGRLSDEVLRTSGEFGLALFFVLALPAAVRWALFRKAQKAPFLPQ